MDTPIFLAGHEAVVEIFGCWPSFHDAEILSLSLDRSEGVRIRMTVHVFEMTRDVDEKGFFILRKHHLVRFEFAGVEDVRLEGFNQQNVLFDLMFAALPVNLPSGPRFKADLNSSFGLEGEFTFSTGRLSSVVPCDSDGILK